MLFGRGQWAILGLQVDSFPQFQATMGDPKKLFFASQLVATIRTRFKNCSTVGINPYIAPRMDEFLAESPVSMNLVAAGVEDIWQYLQLLETMGPDVESVFNPEIYDKAFGAKEEGYLLNKNVFNTYGFWMVFNDYEDISDLASKREQLAYETLGYPYKFSVKDDKTRIDLTASGVTVPIRRQFPVIVDYQTGRVFIASSNKEEIQTVRSVLENMGAKVYSLYWSFGKDDWPRRFLTKVSSDTKFLAEMNDRAEERQRFTKEEVQKLNDKTVEKIVSNYFAIAELPSGQWAALKAPTRVKLSKTGEPVACADPTMAVTLRGLTESFEVISASVVFQELTSKFIKDEEIKTRRDLFTLSIDDNVNNFDAGVAMLKGFDLPKYKAEMKKFLKQHGEALIKDYWYEWLLGIRVSIEYFITSVKETLLPEDDEGITEAKSWGLKEAAFETSPEGQADLSDITVDDLKELQNV